MKTAPNVVLGGGIIGLLTAWYLVENGQTVVVIDKGRLGQESSWAGAGALSPLYPDRYSTLDSLVYQSREDYSQITAKLFPLTGIDSQLIVSELVLLDKQAITSAEQGHSRGKLVTSTTLSSIEPELRKQSGGAVCYPAAQIRNPRLISALRLALASRGVVLLEFHEVHGFDIDQGHAIRRLTTSRGPLETNHCVVTAGAWTRNLLQSTSIQLPIRPIRGQIVVFRARPGLISNIIVRDYRYLVPRADGRILVGSTVEDVGFDNDTTMRARVELQQAAIDMVPALNDYPIEHHWAGLRPGSPDDLPFIGEHPNIKGLFVCAGHYRNGFATGPASARLVVDMMLGRQPTVDPTPFRLDRECPEWRM